MDRITIVQYGTCNVRSIANMLKEAGYTAEISASPESIEAANKIILPGVGSFDSGVLALKNLGLWDVLTAKATDEKIPILGICLGAQLMTSKSEEGELAGFDWIPGKTKRFRIFSANDCKKSIRIPHMGWNYVQFVQDHPIVDNLPSPSRFYFLHSFHFVPKFNTSVLCQTTYGTEFCSGMIHENLFAFQFHPEKSHRFGLQLLKNFAKL